MRLRTVIDEFTDYRAYVSHTLCRHRLLLGLSDQGIARARLNDPAVWPFVGDETKRMLRLSGSLFGIMSKELSEKIHPKAVRVINEFSEHRLKFLDGEINSFFDVVSSAESLRDALTSVGESLERNPPDLSQGRVLAFLNRRSRDTILRSIEDTIDHSLQPIALELVTSENRQVTAYPRIWPELAATYELIRTAIIASAVEDRPREDCDGVREAFRLLQQFERVLSSWSPSLSMEERTLALQRLLGSRVSRIQDWMEKLLASAKAELWRESDRSRPVSHRR